LFFLALRLGTTVEWLRHNMDAIEMDQWVMYFNDNPEEREQSQRIETMLARFATGFFGGEVTDHLILTEKQRTVLDNQKIGKKLSGGK